MYGENIEIISDEENDDEDDDVEEDIGGIESEPVTDSSDDKQEYSGTTGFVTSKDTNNNVIQITGNIAKDAVLTISDLSDHVDCAMCQLLMQNQDDGQIFVNLELTGEYAGKLLVQISASEDLAKYNGQEIVILTCRDGVIWAVRATVLDGFITFFTDEMGPFLILGDMTKLELTEDGMQIILGQEMLPFGGWK